VTGRLYFPSEGRRAEDDPVHVETLWSSVFKYTSATIAGVLRALAGSLFQKFGFFMDGLRICNKLNVLLVGCYKYCFKKSTKYLI
jgi:hypothetical protein